MTRGDPSHIDLTVRSPEAARAFYGAVLGFMGYIGGQPGNGSVAGWMNPHTGFNVALHEAHPEYAGYEHSAHAAGLHHLAFAAESVEDVDRLHDLLVDIGARVLDAPGEYRGGECYAVFFADPDGLKLEYVHLHTR